jgi:hypothetical protein
MFGSVVWRSFDTPEARSFFGRVSGLLAVMLAVAVFEMISGNKDAKASGVAWFYAIAIYASCLVTFNRGADAEAASSRWIAAILALASLHNVYDLWVEFTSKDAYELPKFDADTWISLLVALGAVALLFKFRRTSNPVVRAAWVMGLVDIVTNLENILTTFVISLTGSKLLAIGSDVFDVTVTAFAAVTIYRGAGAERRDQASRGAAP